LRRDLAATSENFPRDVQELQFYFEPAEPSQRIRAVPGAGLRVPIWLLGSSTFSAQLAAMLGLPFSFASHFAPDDLTAAIQLYRERFEPSRQMSHPYAMPGVNVIAADTDAEARRLFTSQQQAFINLRRGTPGRMPPPIDDIDAYWTPTEKAMVEHSLRYAIVGSPETVKRGLESFIALTRADELIIGAHIYEHAARLRSFEIVAGLRDQLAVRAT
jgi:luciferase family oxidoreductase group 1